jgi:hypothetical protein
MYSYRSVGYKNLDFVTTALCKRKLNLIIIIIKNRIKFVLNNIKRGRLIFDAFSNEFYTKIRYSLSLLLPDDLKIYRDF